MFINQLRQKIGVTFGNPETTTGGNALKFYASMRLDVRRIGQVKIGDEFVGGRTRVKLAKNKMAPPFTEAEFEIRYGTGVDVAAELIDLGLARGLVEKSGNHLSFAGTQLGSTCNYFCNEFGKCEPTMCIELQAACDSDGAPCCSAVSCAKGDSDEARCCDRGNDPCESSDECCAGLECATWEGRNISRCEAIEQPRKEIATRANDRARAATNTLPRPDRASALTVTSGRARASPRLHRPNVDHLPALLAQQRRGGRAAPTGAAIHHDLTVRRELTAARAQGVDGDVDSAREVTPRELAGAAHVEQDRPALDRGARLGRCHALRLRRAARCHAQRQRHVRTLPPLSFCSFHVVSPWKRVEQRSCQRPLAAKTRASARGGRGSPRGRCILCVSS